MIFIVYGRIHALFLFILIGEYLNCVAYASISRRMEESTSRARHAFHTILSRHTFLQRGTIHTTPVPANEYFTRAAPRQFPPTVMPPPALKPAIESRCLSRGSARRATIDGYYIRRHFEILPQRFSSADRERAVCQQRARLRRCFRFRI